MTREAAIGKLQAWARWELGDVPEDGGSGGVHYPGSIPSDQADHMTVELALKDFGQGAKLPFALRALLFHVYCEGGVPETFRALDSVPELTHRGAVLQFLAAWGSNPARLGHSAFRRFLKFLEKRLT